MILKPTHMLLPAAIAAALLAAGNASAAPVIYFNGGPDQVVLQLADSTYAYTQAAEEFSLLAGSNIVTAVNWWGGCNVNTGGVLTGGTCPAGSFTLNFYSDSGSGPGALIVSDLVGNANQTTTGKTIAARGQTEYSYSATIPNLTLTPGTQYWLGISDSTAVTSVWGWETTAETIGDAYQYCAGPCASSDIVGWNARTNELAFYLIGVPEPGTLTLFGLAIFGLAKTRRRHKVKA